MITFFKRATLGAVATIGLAGGVASAQNLAGNVSIDGSSTVFPITEAVAEEFSKDHPNVRVTVGVSGSGGGFKRFTGGDTDISNASRPIKKNEYDAAVAAGIEFIELPVAYDGLTIVVNKSNDYVQQLSLEDLQKIFLEKRAAKTWRDVNPSWPAEPIKIYAPGTDSGTFDYFKEVVAPKKDMAIRSDMSVSEDDNVLVNGVAGDAHAIGFFGFAYYHENQDKLRAIPIVNKSGKAVSPTSETIESGDYNPFSRPLFIYVRKDSAARPEVRELVKFYIENAAELAADVGYVALPKSIYDQAAKNFNAGKTGTLFMDPDGNAVEGGVVDIYLK